MSSFAEEPTTVLSPTSQTTQVEPQPSGLSKADIRHNMVVIIMLDAIFNTGFTDLGLAMQPLLVYLHASNSMIGLVSGMQMAGLLGLFLSPWISRRFQQKKWYLLIVNVPYLLALGFIGAALVFSQQLGLSNPELLIWVLVLTIAFWFFGGFCSLPHQEYVAACIPMSHRGRYTGYSYTVGGITSILSAALGGLVLLKVSKPMSFGYLYLMTWAICQSGYLLAVLAREQPSPVEKAPSPWSKAMLLAFWRDRPFLRFLAIYLLLNTLVNPVLGFINIYGFKDLKMIAATAAVIQIITHVVRIGLSALIGIVTDKVGPKKVFPYLPLIAGASFIPPIVMPNAYGVYASVAIYTFYMSALAAASWALIYGLPKPEHRAGHFTIQLIFTYISSSIGPILVGKICDMAPFQVVFGATAVLTIVLSGIGWLILKTLSDDHKAYA